MSQLFQRKINFRSCLEANFTLAITEFVTVRIKPGSTISTPVSQISSSHWANVVGCVASLVLSNSMDEFGNNFAYLAD